MPKIDTKLLEQSAIYLKNWVTDTALPIWAERAQLSDGSWVEHLALDGTADVTAQRRWRVLARQVYVYAHAGSLGWYEGAEIAQNTHARMMQTGYVHRVDIDGHVQNDMKDLYDHAFYLLAHASLYKLTQDRKYLTLAEDILTWLDRDMAHINGGWAEHMGVGGTEPRRQNPHMHIFEASLYLYGVTENPAHLSYAHKVFALFEAHFFNEKTRTIREFFTPDWTPLPAPLGTSAEPGHAAEWVWLLHQYEKASGVNTADYAAALYDGIHKINSHSAAGYFLNDEDDETGETRRESKRLWVQTELIKAHLAQAERGGAGWAGSADMAAALISGLFEAYLTPDGLWQDQLNACGVNMAKTIPVSTFYHILCMAAEAERVSDNLYRQNT